MERIRKRSWKGAENQLSGETPERGKLQVRASYANHACFNGYVR